MARAPFFYRNRQIHSDEGSFAAVQSVRAEQPESMTCAKLDINYHVCPVRPGGADRPAAHPTIG
jgi:hypothetical protein